MELIRTSVRTSAHPSQWGGAYFYFYYAGS